MHRVIGITVVGSYVWNMQKKGSDIDLFCIYKEDIRNILDGTAKCKSFTTVRKYESKEVDMVSHEIGHVVNQLLTGNINFIVGTLSPTIVEDSKEFQKLREITRNYLAKNCYNSINGLAHRNYEKYVVKSKGDSSKKINQILRALSFGKRILKYNKVEFRSTYGVKSEIQNAMSLLNEAFEESDLPDKPPEKPFRNWLLKTRLEEW